MNESIWLSLALGLLLILLVVVQRRWRDRQQGIAASGSGGWLSRSQPHFLLLGPMESGKTLLLARYRFPSASGNGSTTIPATQTSMLPNSVHDARQQITLVDLPGHPRLSFYLDEYAHKTRGILYVLDATASSLLASSRTIAEQLYDLLSHPQILQRSVPITILCNKQDLPQAMSSDRVRLLLEKELELIRSSKSRSLAQNEELETVYLGIDGQEFSFDHLDNPVRWCEWSTVQCENVQEELARWMVAT